MRVDWLCGTGVLGPDSGWTGRSRSRLIRTPAYADRNTRAGGPYCGAPDADVRAGGSVFWSKR